MLMDNSGAREANGEMQQAQFGPEQLANSFETSNENSEALEMNAVDARANDNAETQRMRGELQDMFARNNEEAAEAEAIGEAEPILGDPELEKLRGIDVPRDASTIPSAFASEAQRVLDKSISKDKDPSLAVEQMSEMRWNYMEKAFGRKMGDGLNGNH